MSSNKHAKLTGQSQISLSIMTIIISAECVNRAFSYLINADAIACQIVVRTSGRNRKLSINIAKIVVKK
jgi:hypothetical protein